MTHTQMCENASTPTCYCDCKGTMHGNNPKHGTIEKENPTDYLRQESGVDDERPSAERVDQALEYGDKTGRFSGSTQIAIDRMTPKQRKAFIEEIRNSTKSDNLNDIVRWVNRNEDIVRSYSPPASHGQSKIESDYRAKRESGMARLERNRQEQIERERELEAQREAEYQEARRKHEPLRTRWEFERAKRDK